jgi:NAD(P)-dependent dehydrogenase (short-subunit alcohol dehydrogenase family)
LGQVQGKIAIVTGGASGIGAACAETLAREGATVVITDIDEHGGQDLVARSMRPAARRCFCRRT